MIIKSFLFDSNSAFFNFTTVFSFIIGSLYDLEIEKIRKNIVKYQNLSKYGLFTHLC